MPDEAAGESGVLLIAKIRHRRNPPYIYIEAQDGDGRTRWGITLLENPHHLECLYNKLKENLGKPLSEIGNLEIDLEIDPHFLPSPLPVARDS